MQNAINARQRAWREANPEKSAACSARYRRNNPRKAKESQANYHERLHNSVAEARRLKELLADLSSKPIAWQRAVPILLANPDLSNERIQTLAAVTLSKETIRKMRRAYGLPPTKGIRKTL
jgi:hypothetical protein